MLGNLVSTDKPELVILHEYIQNLWVWTVQLFKGQTRANDAVKTIGYDQIEMQGSTRTTKYEGWCITDGKW